MQIQLKIIKKIKKKSTNVLTKIEIQGDIRFSVNFQQEISP